MMPYVAKEVGYFAVGTKCGKKRSLSLFAFRRDKKKAQVVYHSLIDDIP